MPRGVPRGIFLLPAKGTRVWLLVERQVTHPLELKPRQSRDVPADAPQLGPWEMPPLRVTGADGN